MMKFVHIADMHLDSPFVNLAGKANLPDLRRLEQRKVFKKIIEYIKEHQIDCFFISGDLYEQKYVKKSTMDYINQLFREIPETKIFITPGNHDPYLKNSYYTQYVWEDNVTIFSANIKKIQLDEVDIYGYGFDDYYCQDCGIEPFEIENKEKSNILLLHATLDGANLEDKQYNSIPKRILREKGFDYVALGHIHKSNYCVGEKICYPGSPVSLGFDELGKHGIIVGEIKNKTLKTEFVVTDESEFLEKQVDVSDVISKEELVEKIDACIFSDHQLAKIVLVGSRGFEINAYEIEKLISNERVIRVKDETKIAYDLEKMAKQNTLKGIFIQEMMSKLERDEMTKQDRQIIEKAIEIGLDALQ